MSFIYDIRISNLDPKSTKDITYFNMHVKISNSIFQFESGFQLVIWNLTDK
jgi:hypothetical protein